MHLTLIGEALRLNLKRLWQFRTSLFLEIASSLAYAAVTIVFWKVIYTKVRPLPGWNLGETFAFTAFTELFYALNMSLFVATGKFWTSIITGRIDIYLIRPVDPRLLMGLLAIRIENLIRAVPSVSLLTWMAVANGARFSFLTGVGALGVVLLGSIAYACLQMAGSWASFWLGRTQVLDEVTDSLSEFAQYPHTIFPEWVRLVLLTAVPMGLAATQPALLLSGRAGGAAAVIGIAALVALVWWVFQQFVWKRGLKRYDSYGG